MRIAVASKGLGVSPSLSHCVSFTCYEIECGIIVECQNMPNPLKPARQLATMFHELDIRALIVGSIEQEAADAFQDAGIEVVSNQTGTARDAMEAYLARALVGFDENDDEEFDAVEA